MYPTRATSHIVGPHTPSSLRPIVLRRKVSGQTDNDGGMRRPSVLFACLLTERKRKPDICREWSHILLPAV
ncbi:MAG: hypothetical protein IS632_07755 [Thaumarchaeota archaeon]|nr:hypothetical protein [Nitrososphaerota archaeon]